MTEQLNKKKLNDNPCKYIDRPTRGKIETEVLTIDEALKVLDNLNLNKYNDYIMYLALNICLELGLRRGELAGLQWKHIDNNKKTITIEDNLIYVNGHTYLNYEDLKTQASSRTLPASWPFETFRQPQKTDGKQIIMYGKHYIDNIYNWLSVHFIMSMAGQGPVLTSLNYTRNPPLNGGQ